VNTNWNDGVPPPEMKDPVWYAGQWNERAEAYERMHTDATPSNLPLFDSVEAPQVGTADVEDRSGGHQHQKGDIERAPQLLRRQLPEKRAPGRPRRTDHQRLESEERTCAIADTAEWNDWCTCGHMRNWHHRAGQGQRTPCTLCQCDAFTKDSPTLYDERAAANWERNHGRTP